MNKHTPESQLAERFNRELEKLEMGHSAPSEEMSAELREHLQLAQHLIHTNLATGSERVQSAVRRRLIKSMAHSQAKPKGVFPMSRLSTLRPVALAIALLLVASLFFSPVRSFAAGVLHQIGWLSLSSEQTLPEQLAAGQTTSYSPPAEGIEMRPTIVPPAQLTVVEAVAEADFAVADITPPAGYSFTTRTVYGEGSYSDGGGATVHTIYNKMENGQVSFIGLEQAQYPEGVSSTVITLKIGAAPVTETSIRGQRALFVEQTNIVAVPSEGGDEWQAKGTNLLLWEEDGFLFSLMSDTLAMAELEALAATMTR